jgi:hypothetical protein
MVWLDAEIKAMTPKTGYRPKLASRRIGDIRQRR